MKTYFVRLIEYEGKNRVIREAIEIYADHYDVDGNNNLIFYGTQEDKSTFVIMYHSYNWFSVEL